MSQQTINVGSGELTGDGESIRTAFQKVNSNFTELYSTAIGPTGPAGPAGPPGIAFSENKSWYVDINGDNSNDGRNRGQPLRNIARALSSATNGDTVFISPGLFVETYPLDMPKGVTVRGSGLRATTISPTTATNSLDGFLLDGETTLSDFSMVGQYYNTATNTGYAFKVGTTSTFTTRSPYLERISIINRGSVTTANDPYGFSAGDAGRGVHIDGSYISTGSVESALLLNEFTLIVPGSVGLYLTNGARVEMLTSFIYFADKAILAQTGNNGRFNNGKTKLRISGYSGPAITTGTQITLNSSTGVLLGTGAIESYNTVTGLISIAGKSEGFQEVDTEAPGHTLVLEGNATYSTADKKFGISSLKFDNPLGNINATGFVRLYSNDAFYLGTNDFTIEFHFKALAAGQNQYLIAAQNWDIVYTASTSIVFNIKNSAGTVTATLTQTGPFLENTWHLVSISRSSGSIYFHINGFRNSIAVPVNYAVLNTSLIRIGAGFESVTFGFTGYIDNVRISKNIGRYNINDYTAPVTAFTADNYAILLINETASSGVKLIDSAVPKQSIVFSNGGTADFITLADYKEFGSEVRSIACAHVYGNVGVYANGVGNVITLMAHNFSYIGEGGDLSNDPDLVNQSNETVAVNGAAIYYNSIDQKGDVRIGDFFLADQQRGRLTFNADDLNLYGLTSLSFNENGGIVFGDGTVQLTSGNKSFSGLVYVDKGGNDSTANGSLSLPFKTIQAAHNYIATNYKNTVNEGSHIAIFINPGDYAEQIVLSRPKTHLVALTRGITRATNITGSISIANTASGGLNTNIFTLQNLNITNTISDCIQLTGTLPYTLVANNVRILSTVTGSSSINSFVSAPVKIIINDSEIRNQTYAPNIITNNSNSYEINNSTIRSFYTASFYNSSISTQVIQNTTILDTDNTGSTVQVNSGIVELIRSKIVNGQTNGTGLYVSSSSSVTLEDVQFSVGAIGASGKAIAGAAGGTIYTANVKYSPFSNDEIEAALTNEKMTLASSVHQHVLPAADLTYDLGSTSSQWRSLYVGTSTIYLGGTALSVSGGNITVDGSPVGGGGASLGQFKISGNNLGTVDNPDTGGWGGWDMYIDPGNGSDAFIYIPGVPNQAAGTNLQISNNSTAGAIQLFGRGGVQVVTNHGVNEKVFEFADNGVLIIPDAILGSGDQAVVIQNTASGVAYLQLPVDPSADSVILANQAASSATVTIRVGDFGSEKDWTFANDGTLLVPAGSTIRPPESISTTGGSLIFRAGDSQEQAAGSITLRAGDTLGSLGPANGGDFIARAGTTVTGDGGQAQLEGGTTVVGNGGALLLYSGQAVTGDGGDIALLAGTTVTGDGGGVNIESGEAVTGDAGDITITARGTTTGNGGNIELTAGSAITGYGGDIFLTAGDHVNTGAPGEPGVIRLRTVNYTSNKDWIFGNGNLSVPGVIYNNDTSNVGQLLLAGDAGESATYLALPSDVGSTSMNVRLSNINGNIQLYAGNNSWLFNDGGDIQLPRSGLITETIVTNEMWGTTTTSLTLVPGGAANGTQRLEIYSTGGGEGNHIHIRSGDQEQTDLFLGNDTQYFAVTASGANYIQARNGAASPTPGTSAGAGANVNISAGSAGDNGGNVADGNSGGDVFISSGISTLGLGGDILINTSSGPDGFGSIELSTDGGSSAWTFNKDNELVFPGGGDIVFDSSATSYIYGVTGIEFADATTQTTAFTGTSALLDITNTNGLTTPYYLTFVENRAAGQEVRADVDLVYDCADNLLRTGAFSATNYITVGGILNTNRGVHEKFTTATTASSVVSYDCATTQLFYHATTGTVANWTANFTNLSLEAGRATTVNIIINQGNTGYYPSAVQVGGAAQTLNWQGNTTPSVSANRTDVVTFSILNNSGSYIVLGQLTGF